MAGTTGRWAALAAIFVGGLAGTHEPRGSGALEYSEPHPETEASRQSDMMVRFISLDLRWMVAVAGVPGAPRARHPVRSA